jgi:hypothetical protein
MKFILLLNNKNKLNQMKLITLLLIPLQLSTNKPGVEKKDHAQLEYHEHIRQKLNKILEIPDGRNYWEREFKTVIYENKLKEYLK